MSAPYFPFNELTVNSAKELEHFERIRQSFESSTTKETESSQPRTIADAIEDLSLGGEIVSNGGPIMNGDSNHTHKGMGSRQSSSNTKGKSGRVVLSGNGKGKNKPIINGGGDSDSSFDGYQPSLRSESTHSRNYDVGEEADVDGVEDGDTDDYVVKTGHLAHVD